jgi:chromosome segregation protein
MLAMELPAVISHHRDAIATLRTRIEQLARDSDRESALNRDAGDSMARLDWEAREIARAAEGHEARLDQAALAAREAAAVLQAGEADLGRTTEDVARIAARHQSAQRLIEDHRRTRAKAQTEAARAAAALTEAEAAFNRAEADLAAAQSAETTAVVTATRADETLLEAEAARVMRWEAITRAHMSSLEARASRPPQAPSFQVSTEHY